MADKILGGGSCEGLGGTVEETTVDEIRKVRDDSHKNFWPTIDFCLDKGSQIYLTFDSYTKSHRGWDSEENLRQEIESTIIEYERRIADKNLGLYRTRNRTLLTLDNEFEEVPGASIEKYLNWLRIFKSQIAGRYKIGAGNFSSNSRYMAWYRILCQHKDLFDVLCIHLQSDFEAKSKMDKNKKLYQEIIKDFEIKRVTCTEGVATNWDLSKDYPLVEYQFNFAKQLNCEGYCAVFIKDDPAIPAKWKKFVFSRYPDAFKKFIKLIQDNKPEEKEDDMELKDVYKNGMKDEIGLKFVQMILNADLKPKPLLKIDGWWGDKTNPIVIAYQQKYKLAIYEGALGPNTFMHMIKTYPDIWNIFDYRYRAGLI
jgi:hypothetical protein